MIEKHRDYIFNFGIDIVVLLLSLSSRVQPAVTISPTFSDNFEVGSNKWTRMVESARTDPAAAMTSGIHLVEGGWRLDR